MEGTAIGVAQRNGVTLRACVHAMRDVGVWLMPGLILVAQLPASESLVVLYL